MRAPIARLAAALLAFLLLFGLGTAAAAHTKSETNSSWEIIGTTVRLTFTAPDVEVKRLKTPTGAMATNDQLIAYLQKRIWATAEDKPCPLAHPPTALTAAPNYHRVEFTFACPSPKGVKLHSGAFIDLVPTHVNFAQIQPDNGDFVEQVFTQGHETVDLSAGRDNKLQNASFFQYVFFGIMHIFTGLDHQCFLLGMVMISRRLRDLTFVVTGFTIGHSLTLALAVTGVIRPHAEFIDALVALTIVLIGVENVVAATHKPGLIAAGMGGLLLLMAAAKLLGLGALPTLLLVGGGLFSANYLMISGHLKDAGRLRLVVTLVFGLIHGFGFASGLLEMKLPANRLAELLVGFNIGVEIGQLSLVLAVTGLVYVLGRMRLALPRPIVVDVGSAFLVCIGLYWFITRSYPIA